MIEVWRAFASIVRAHIKQTLARPMVQIALLIQPVIIATTTFFIYRQSQVGDYTAYMFLGGGMAGVWSVMTFSSSTDLERERSHNTLGIMLASRTSLAFVFAAKVLANAIVALISPLINVAYSCIVLGIPLHLPHPFGLGLSLAAFLFGCSAFALSLSTVFLLSRTTRLFINAIEYALLLVSGVLFPITILPDWLQAVAQAVPLVWGMQAMRMAFDAHELGASFVASLAWCLALGVLYAATAMALFQVIERRARQAATLELY